MRRHPGMIAVGMSLARLNALPMSAKPRKLWRKMSAPHDYPPSPNESRQVRRARLRRDAAALARTEDGGRNDG